MLAQLYNLIKLMYEACLKMKYILYIRKYMCARAHNCLLKYINI